MTEQQALRRRIYALEFAAWELHLFLDSHPGNCEAAEKLEEYRRRAAALREEYAQKFCPLGDVMAETSRWAWINDPWPWEEEAN